MNQSDFPRRIRINQFTPAERAIWEAHQAVEALPPDVRLTEASNLLSAARAKVADYVDGVGQ
jgi:predicted metal-dependent hydrolase